MARWMWAALALGVALAGAAGAGAQAPVDGSNGIMGQLTGAGGDPVLGAKVYATRCASCHDNPTGRTPPKAAIADASRAHIVEAMFEGIMKPMAAGLSPHEMVSIATYLSTRPAGGTAPLGDEAPLCKGAPPPMTLNGPQWNGWGRTVTQSRYQPDPGFAATDAPKLKLKWAFAYPGARSGQATVAGGRVFINSFSGSVYALDARTGCAWWRFEAQAGTRTSIVIGALPGARGAKPRYAAYFADFSRTAYAVDAETGALIWKRQVDDQREVQMTGSPVLSGGRLFVPISSAEEAIATDDNYECCKFRGAVAAVDAATGRMLWKTYVTEPAKPYRKNAKGRDLWGPAGGAIWSAPTVDAKRGLIYVATGDSYTDKTFDTADAILALDMKTGALRWKQQVTANDDYIIGCYGAKPKANCPAKAGPDHDFGASPILHTLPSGRQLILAGQKSSQVYALDPDKGGRIVWTQRLSSGGALGGVEFGMAADAATLYVPIADIYPTAGGQAKPGLSALNIADGKVLWTTPTPKLTCAWKNAYCSPAMSQAVTATPGLVFGGSMDGRFRAFAARTGKVVWEVDTAAAPVRTVSGRQAIGGVLDAAGPTVAGGMVYVNSGYQARSGVAGSVLMAFGVD